MAKSLKHKAIQDNKMRKTILKRQAASVTAILLIICMFAAPVFAMGRGSKADRVLKVGFFAFDGYHIQAEDGSRSGYGYDFLQEMGRYGDWTYQYVGYDKSWADMQKMLAEGKIDILTSAQKTAEREKQFAFSDEAIGTSSAMISVKSGDSRWTAGDYETYNGIRIGMLAGSSRNAKLESFAADKGFSYKPVYYDEASLMEADLQKGKKIDAIFTSNLRQVNNEWILDQFDTSDFYVMVRKNDVKLLAEINAAISAMDANLPGWRDDLWNRYYVSDSGDEIAFTPAERAFIKKMNSEGKVFNAIVEPDRAPYSYFVKGKAAGIIPEIFEVISKKTGLKFNIIETKDRKSYFDAVNQQNGLDVRIDAYNDYYDAEQKGYKLTEPFFTSTVSIVTLKSMDDEPKTIALAKNADPTDYRTELLKSGKVQLYDSVEECLDEVAAGNEDATYLLTYSAQKYISDSDYTGKLESALLPQYSVSYAIGVADNEDARLVTILDKAVNNLQQTDVETITLKQTQFVEGVLTPAEYLESNPWALMLVCVGLMLIFLLAALLVIKRRSMQAVEKINIQLSAEALRADRANAAKSDFLSRMSHDMRTPLNVILGLTHLSLQRDHSAETTDELNKINASSVFLLGLINDVLDMTKAESGKIELHPEPYPIEEFAAYIEACIRPLCEENDITLLLDSQPVLDYIPLMDKLRTNQIIFNLLSNAVKFSPAGGAVKISLLERMTEKGKLSLEVRVSDNGIGMSEEFQKQMFDVFAQEQRNDNSPHRGTGLGLAIVKNIVELMGGTIVVDSRPGEGTTFDLNGEVDCIPADQFMSPDSIRDAEDERKLEGLHILLCEDHPMNQEIARKLLEKKGIIVDIADNGQRGVDKFSKSLPGFYDVILMDIRMPVMDGYEATRRIRSMDRSDAGSIPIIAMTADAFADDVQKSVDVGMNGHIAKPVEPEKMYEIIVVLTGR